MISRESSDEEDVVQVELRHDGVSGYGEGGADRALRRDGRVRACVSSRQRRPRLGDDPFALERDRGAPAAGRERGQGGARRRAARPAGEAARRPRLEAARPAAHRAADLVDRLARRSRRHGAPRREGGAALPPPEAEARRRRRARRRARPRRPGRHRAAASGRRQRVVVARRGARRAAAAARARRRVLRAAAPCGRRGRADAEGPLADPDLRRRGLPPARQRRRLRARSRTGSTSSWRSRVGSARRSGWRTRRARSGSASCSAA